MAEREIYNPDTGQFEIVYDDGIYETTPQAPPPAASPFDPPPQAAAPPPTTTPPPASNNRRPRDVVEREGREYDRQHGLVGGYYDEQTGLWVSGSPSSGPGDGGDPFSKMAQGRPAFAWPGFESAGPFTPRNGTLVLDPFTPSSWEDAEREPGYRPSSQRLQKQIESGAAYQGMLRSGNTFDRLGSVLTDYAQQNFANFDNRRFRNWEANNDAKTTAFGVNLGVDREVYNSRATDIDRGNRFRFDIASKEFDAELSRWLEQVRSLTQLARPPV